MVSTQCTFEHVREPFTPNDSDDELALLDTLKSPTFLNGYSFKTEFFTVTLVPALRNFDFVYEFCYTWKNHFLKTQVWTQACCLRGKGTKKHYLSIIFFCTYFHLHISIIFRQELGIQPAYHQFVAPWYIWRKLITGNKTAGSQLSNFFLIKKRTLAITTQNVIGRKTLWFTSRLY